MQVFLRLVGLLALPCLKVFLKFLLQMYELASRAGQGGLKLWEGSLDLVKALSSEVQNGHLSFTGKRVLEGSLKLQMVLLMAERYGSFRLSRHGIHVDQTLSLFFISLFQSPPLWPPICNRN